MKTCCKCKKQLATNQFCKHKHSTCHACETTRKKKWKEKNRSKQRFYQKQTKLKSRRAVGKYTKAVLEEKLSYWGNKCWCCGTSKDITLDHVKPISKGGTNWVANIRPCCSSCNSIKNNKWPKPGNVRHKLTNIRQSVLRRLGLPHPHKTGVLNCIPGKPLRDLETKIFLRFSSSKGSEQRLSQFRAGPLQLV